MVQQGYAKRGYSNRAVKRRAAAGGGEDVSYPAGRATVQAGLRSFALNPLEQKRFAARAADYREARLVLGGWWVAARAAAAAGALQGGRVDAARLAVSAAVGHCSQQGQQALLLRVFLQEHRAGQVGHRHGAVFGGGGVRG